ncbi:hypothetical protein ACG2LH_07090 [Zhouia sp. PK063]|uniref:hypothetical protein n=1 Tax=Zhouia sp. PK063 TaxID=3373602 RepID=UPI0037B02B5D
MMKKLSWIFLLVLIIISGCTKKQSDLAFEKSVFQSIFPRLLDSVFYDVRLEPPSPPAPTDIVKFKESAVPKDFESKIIKDIDERKNQLKNDTTKLIIAIVDSTYGMDETEIKELIKFYGNDSLKLRPINLKTPYKIEISSLTHHKKFGLKYLSELQSGNEESNIWKKSINFISQELLVFRELFLMKVSVMVFWKVIFNVENFVEVVLWYSLGRTMESGLLTG